MISKLYTIISNKLWDLSLYFWDLYNRWSLQVSKKLHGLVNARDFEQCKHIEIIVLAICWRLSAFKSPSHEKSIFLKIRSFFPSNFFRATIDWLTTRILNFMVIENCDMNFMLCCRLIYMLSMLYVRLKIKVKVGIPESFKVGWYPHKITELSHLNTTLEGCRD